MGYLCIGNGVGISVVRSRAQPKSLADLRAAGPMKNPRHTSVSGQSTRGQYNAHAVSDLCQGSPTSEEHDSRPISVSRCHKRRCERRDSNPHGCCPLDPKSSASANSATLAWLRNNDLRQFGTLPIGGGGKLRKTIDDGEDTITLVPIYVHSVAVGHVPEVLRKAP